MRLDKTLKRFVYVFLGLIALIWLTNVVLSGYLSNKVKDLLVNQSIENYRISVDRVKFRLLDRSITITNFMLSPKDSILQQIKDRSMSTHSAQIISSSAIRLRNIHFLEALLHKNYYIGILETDDLLVQHMKVKDQETSLDDQPASGVFHLDSIRIDGLMGLELHHIKMNNLKFQIIDLQSGDLNFENKPFGFEVAGIKLEPIGNDYFELNPIEEDFSLENIHMEMSDKHYRFSLDRIGFDFKNKQITAEGLRYEPSIEIEQLASMLPFNDDIFSLTIKNISVYRPVLKDQNGLVGLIMDSLVMGEPDIRIFKDKTKPFNQAKRPALFHEKLKTMGFPFRIARLKLQNGNLRYAEKLPKASDHMLVRMKDLQLRLDNVTSIQEYREKPLEISMAAKFMNEAPFEIQLELPLRDDLNTFFLHGKLHKSSFQLYDEAIFPALGVKVLSGTMQDLEFNAKGNSRSSTGTMVMRYSDLKTEVSRLKSEQKSGFLSWSVNQVVHKSNPGANGKLRVAIMEFERTPYKGLGNYLWKTIESGIINTVSPVGLTEKKMEAREKRQLKREQKKKKREASS